MQDKSPDNYTHFENHDREMARLETVAGFDDLSFSEQKKIDKAFFEEKEVGAFVMSLYAETGASMSDIWYLLEALRDIEDRSKPSYCESMMLDELESIADSKTINNEVLKTMCAKMAKDWIEYRNEQVDEL